MVPTGLYSQVCGNSSSQDWSPGLGRPRVRLDPRLCSHILPPGAWPPGVGAGPAAHASAPPASLLVAFSLCPQMYVLGSARLQSVLRIACFIIGCNFNVVVGRSEPGVNLARHPDPHSTPEVLL